MTATRSGASAVLGGYTIIENAALGGRNSFGVAARAAMLVDVRDAAALPELLGYAALRDGPALVLGDGSNVLFAADYDGCVLSLRTGTIAIVRDDGDSACVRADAGVGWDDLVRWTLGHGLGGLENLALIPGTVGACPIQNIGAYGTEVGDCIEAVEAFERDTRQAVRLSNAQCGFGYRDSAFKREPERWLVTAVEFRLSRARVPRIDYAGLPEELAAMGVALDPARPPRPSLVAEAVSRLRRRKLPDPAVLGNAGSFFKNPIVEAERADALRADYSTLPLYRGPRDDLRKLSAAWLIETCGWKGYRDLGGDAGIAQQHALVLVNHGHATGAELLDLARRVAASVQARFGVALEPEPRLIGARWTSPTAGGPHA